RLTRIENLGRKQQMIRHVVERNRGRDSCEFCPKSDLSLFDSSEIYRVRPRYQRVAQLATKKESIYSRSLSDLNNHEKNNHEKRTTTAQAESKRTPHQRSSG